MTGKNFWSENRWPLVDFFHRLSKRRCCWQQCSSDMISVLPGFRSLCRNRAAVFYDPYPQTLGMLLFLLMCSVLLCPYLSLPWGRETCCAGLPCSCCGHVSGLKDALILQEGSRMLIREAAKPVSSQDVVPYPCSHSLHTWIMTELPDVDTTKLREQELPAYQRLACAIRACRVIYPLWLTTSGLLTWGWKRSLQGPHTRN